MAANPKDGTLWISEPNTRRVYRIEPDAAIPKLEIMAGTGEECDILDETCGDGGPALKATFSALRGSASIIWQQLFTHFLVKFEKIDFFLFLPH